MQPVEIPLFKWFNLFHTIFTFLWFPIVILTYYYTWWIGLGYLGVVVILSLLLQFIPSRVSFWILTPMLSALTFYAFQLALGVGLTCLVWIGISFITLLFNYASYKKNRQHIQQHRVGIPLSFTFPSEAPEGMEEQTQLDYFDPKAFEIAFLDTIIVPLQLEYTVDGVAYKQTYPYHWHTTPWEGDIVLTTYEQALSGQPLLLQYQPEHPKQLLEVINPNYLSTFEAFVQENFKKSLRVNIILMILFLAIAALFQQYV